MKKILIICLMLLALLLVGCESSEEIEDVEETMYRTIDIDAERFMFSPDEIVIKKGESVKLNIINRDTAHGIKIPALGISGTDELFFSIDEVGEYDWKCNVYCGEGHKQMSGKIIVE